MKCVVVGSADAFNAAGRGHSCYWVEGLCSRPVMIDFGATALMGLGQRGLDPRRLGGIALTHFHGDHTGGLPFLMIDGMYNRPRREALTILGPPGVAGRLDRLHRACYGDLIDRDRPFPLTHEEIRAGQRRLFLGAEVQAWSAEHGDEPGMALGLAFHGPQGGKVVFSGDTAMTPELLEMSAGADLLVAECTSLDGEVPGHCSWAQWRQALPGLGAARVVLSHLSDRMRGQLDALRREVPSGVEVHFADDGMVLEF